MTGALNSSEIHLRHLICDRRFNSSSPVPLVGLFPGSEPANGTVLAGASEGASALSSASSREIGDADKPCGDDRARAPHRYEKYGTFGASCIDCGKCTVWDSSERRYPSPCMGARS